MVYTCFSCKWRSDRDPKRSFHQFPSNAELKQKWLDILGKSDSSIGKRTSLCCLHFEENCFRYGSVMGRKILKDGCFPTLHLPKNVQKEQTIDSVDDKKDTKMKEVTSASDNEDNLLENEKPTTDDVEMKDLTSESNKQESDVEAPESTTEVEMKDQTSKSNIDDNLKESPQPTTDDVQMKESTSQSNIQNGLVKRPQPSKDNVQIIVTTSLSNIQNNLLNAQKPTSDHVQMIITTSQSNIQNNFGKGPMQFGRHKGLRGISGTQVIEHWKGEISNLRAQMSELKRTVKKLRNSKIKLKSQVRDLKMMVRKYEAEEKSKKVKLDPIPKALYELMQVSRKRVQTYSQPLREFAWSLSHLSPKAYTYVRKVFPVLPHDATLRKWTHTVELKPGVCQATLSVLEKKSIQAKMAAKRLLCTVTVADMAVRDYEKSTKLVPKPKDVMVIMAVCLNENWKLPLAYYFTGGLGIDDRTNVIKECFERIHDTGVTAVALTFDGCPMNFAVARKLGADMARFNFHQSFPHPVTKDPVHVLLDAGHAIKLVRNTTRCVKKLWDGFGNLIDWEYFKKLVALHNEYDLQEGIKIRQRHIGIFPQTNYYQKKMQEKLAVQLLNQNVSNALEYFRSQRVEFEGSFGTEQFCLIMHDLFELMNSRQPTSDIPNGECINKDNIEDIAVRVFEYENYMKGIRRGRMTVLDSKRRLGFYSLIVSLRSALNVFERYGMDECPSLEYLSTYKLCQGHLEMLFSDVRVGGGHCNIPTMKQFESALKCLLIDEDVAAADFGNGVKQENSYIWKASTRNKKIDVTSTVDSSV